MKRVTIKEVAKAAGVSTMTVSRVLNERPDVSAATRSQGFENGSYLLSGTYLHSDGDFLFTNNNGTETSIKASKCLSSTCPFSAKSTTRVISSAAIATLLMSAFVALCIGFVHRWVPAQPGEGRGQGFKGGKAP